MKVILAPPGAGLPWLELQVAKLGFGWLSRHVTEEKSATLIENEHALIMALAGRCDEASGKQRVLIKRLRGMEDSSRYWSVFMTLDHLRIVNSSIVETIGLLARGEQPKGVASTAAVKPDPQADASVIQEFESSCRRLQPIANQVPNLKTPVRHAHPWFGQLDAGQWYYLAGFHMRLHRQQIEQIILHGS